MNIRRSLFIFALVLAAACASAQNNKRAHAESSAPFPSSAAWHKLDLRLQTAWDVAVAHDDRRRSLECLLKIDGPVTPKQQRQLTKAGFKTRASAGAIITGSVTVQDVEQVAELPTVKVMELAVPLSTK